MSKKQQYLWLTAAFVFAFCVIYYMLTPLFTSPGHIMLDPSGDGAKNYFTYLYQSLYGNGTWFYGMNYPYGEHVIYTDDQPLVAMLVSGLGRIIHVDRNTALGVMHVSIAISYIFSIIVTYKILIEYKVRPWLAILFASLVIIMSPQVLRLTGHFALSHAFYIPALIYLVLRYDHTDKKKYLVYLLVISILMAFIHPYFLGISLLFIGFYAIAYCIFRGGKLWTKVKKVLPLLGAIVCSMIIVKLILVLTDPMTDRPTAPYGTLMYLTEDPDYLNSAFSPIWQFIKARGWYTKELSSGGEGYSYMGLVPIITSIIVIIGGITVLILSKIKGEKLNNKTRYASACIWLFVALSALTLAKGIPFKWHMLWLFDYISALKQFRTLGRFSWLFYYVITLFAIVAISRYYEWLLARRKVLAYIFVAIPLCIWSLEAKGYLDRIKVLNNNYANGYKWFFMTEEQNWNDYLAKQNHKPSDFQAIITLPFTHIGSEKLWLNAFHYWNIVIAYRAGIQLKLPLVDVNMSRSSWSQTKMQVRTAGGPWADKPLLRTIKSNKPFLLLKFDDIAVNDDENYLLSASDSIGHFSQFYIYACYPDRLRHNDQQHHDSIKSIYTSMSKGDTCLGCRGTWYVNHFDSSTSDQHIFSKGSQEPTKKEELVTEIIPIEPAYDNELYEISYWALLEPTTYQSPYIVFNVLDSNDNQVGWGDALIKEGTDNDGKMWFRASRYFSMPASAKKIRIILHNDLLTSYLRFDELMIRPADAVIISKGADGSAMVNNHVYKP